jgi:hypothetical protein
VTDGVTDFEAVLVVEEVPDRVFDGLTEGVFDGVTEEEGDFVRDTDGVRVPDGVRVELNELPLDGVFV